VINAARLISNKSVYRNIDPSLLGSSKPKPKLKLSADDRGIHNASCENRTPCVFPSHQLISPEAMNKLSTKSKTIKTTNAALYEE